jgi:hypothetical protein
LRSFMKTTKTTINPKKESKKSGWEKPGTERFRLAPASLP